MGGSHGFGPVIAEEDEPVFHARWEARALALTLAAGAGGRWNIDMSRFARENTEPGQLPEPQLLRDVAVRPREADRPTRHGHRPGGGRCPRRGIVRGGDRAQADRRPGGKGDAHRFHRPPGRRRRTVVPGGSDRPGQVVGSPRAHPTATVRAGPHGAWSIVTTGFSCSPTPTPTALAPNPSTSTRSASTHPSCGVPTARVVRCTWICGTTTSSRRREPG